MFFRVEEDRDIYLGLRVTVGKLCQQRMLDAMQNWLVPNVVSVVQFSKNLINPQKNLPKGTAVLQNDCRLAERENCSGGQ